MFTSFNRSSSLGSSVKKRHHEEISRDDKAAMLASKSKIVRLENELKRYEFEEKRKEIEQETKRKEGATKLASELEKADQIQRKYVKYVFVLKHYTTLQDKP